ncbi:unnamed protein product, partial [Callosobruchus maculatus]
YTLCRHLVIFIVSFVQVND